MPLYYYERISGLEVDFIVTQNQKIVALEVKAGENTKSKSLTTLLDENEIKYGIRLSRKQFSNISKIAIWPLYYAIFIS